MLSLTGSSINSICIIIPELGSNSLNRLTILRINIIPSITGLSIHDILIIILELGSISTN